MSILDNAKEVARAVQQIQNLELYQRVLALHSDIIELVEENKRLRAENEDLKTKKDIGRRLRLDRGDHVYYLLNEEGQGQDGPFCTVCWDIDQKLVRPTPYENDLGHRYYLCEYCRSHRSSRR